MTDEDDQPITVKLSVRNAENPLWEAADKLKQLILVAAARTAYPPLWQGRHT
jgi:hypothetical protein